jgi:hypothetical protein
MISLRTTSWALDFRRFGDAMLKNTTLRPSVQEMRQQSCLMVKLHCIRLKVNEG